MGNEIKFKPATFYLGIVDHLAKAVEGLKPEDVNAERDGDDRCGHGEILDAASQATVTIEECVTKPLPTKLPSNEPVGRERGTGQIPNTGFVEPTVTSKHNEKAADAPLPAILDIATPTLVPNSDSHTPPTQHHTRESGPKAKPHDDG